MIPVGIMGAILKGSQASRFICYFYEQMATDNLFLYMMACVYAVQYKQIYKTTQLKVENFAKITCWLSPGRIHNTLFSW